MIIQVMFCLLLGAMPLQGGKSGKAGVESAGIMPVFPGGESAWMRFMNKNLKMKDADDIQISNGGTSAKYRFIVNEDGTLSNFEILVSGGKALDQAMHDVVKKSPKWIPGSTGGKKLKVYHKQPISISYAAD